jgi:DNA-binding NarL/FixJ family response regulator
LENLFQSETDFQILARCTTGSQAIEAVRKYQPDILLLDIRMPEKGGLAVLQELNKEATNSRVIVLTAGLDGDDVHEAIRLGVRGLVLKEAAPELLIQCIRKVHAGDKWLDRASLQQAMTTALTREKGLQQIGNLLTRREIEIARLVGEGLRNRDIGNRLFITEGTVKIHLHRIYEKLKLDGRLALVLYVRENGLTQGNSLSPMKLK